MNLSFDFYIRVIFQGWLDHLLLVTLLWVHIELLLALGHLFRLSLFSFPLQNNSLKRILNNLEWAIFFLSHQTIIKHILDLGKMMFVRLNLFLQLDVLLLHLMEQSQLSVNIFLHAIFILLLFFYLNFCPSSLGSSFHEMTRISFWYYIANAKHMMKRDTLSIDYLPLTALLSRNILAISGSRVINMFYSALILSFLYSTLLLTHFENCSPHLVYITLAIYYLGSFLISLSIGKHLITIGHFPANSSISWIERPSN